MGKQTGIIAAVRKRQRRRARGFTLLEMLLVMLLIGGLMAIVAAINLVGQAEEGRRKTTEISMRTIQQALVNYNFANGAFPTSQQGLAVLVPGQLNSVPLDAWKHDFAYYAPTGDQQRPYDLYSLGKDGLANTEDDISVWDIDQQ